MSAITISTLDDPVAIVHIPIHLADVYATHLYWSVTNAPELSDEFFNVTSNQIEIAVFAHTDLINQQWANIPDDRLQISSSWRVFEISSGDGGDSNNYDSPHLRHVSAPLSKAGISILYQSSYFSDYILVRETNFARASEIFAQQGWNFETSKPSPRRRSQLLSPITPISRTAHSQDHTPLVPVITVLSSPLACVGFAKTSERSTEERIRQLVVWPEQARKSWKQKRRSNSHLTDSTLAQEHVSEEVPDRPFISYTRTIDGASIVTETRLLRSMFGRKKTGHARGGLDGDDYDDRYGSEGEGTEYQLDGQLAVGYVTDTTDLEDSDEDEDDYAEAGADWDGAGIHGTSAASVRDGRTSDAYNDSLVSGLHTPPADDDKRARHLSLPTSPRDTPGGQSSMPISWRNNAPARRSTVSLKSTSASEKRRSWDTKSRSHSSRTTDTDELGDAHDGIELATSDRTGRKRCLQLDLRALRDDDEMPMSSQVDPTSVSRGDDTPRPVPDGHVEGEGLGNTAPQVYHMDKSGLVTNFSDLLNSSSIRMLYSSTFHTANILVEARDVHRARRLLQGRRGSPPGGRGGYF